MPAGSGLLGRRLCPSTQHPDSAGVSAAVWASRAHPALLGRCGAGLEARSRAYCRGHGAGGRRTPQRRQLRGTSLREPGSWPDGSGDGAILAWPGWSGREARLCPGSSALMQAPQPHSGGALFTGEALSSEGPGSDLKGPGPPSDSPRCRQGGAPSVSPRALRPSGPGRSCCPHAVTQPGPSAGGRAGVTGPDSSGLARGAWLPDPDIPSF